jgi:hypothetical protein
MGQVYHRLSWILDLHLVIKVTEKLPESHKGQVDLTLHWILDLQLVIKVTEKLPESHEGQVDLTLNWILDLHLVIKVKSYLKVMRVKKTSDSVGNLTFTLRSRL